MSFQSSSNIGKLRDNEYLALAQLHGIWKASTNWNLTYNGFKSKATPKEKIRPTKENSLGIYYNNFESSLCHEALRNAHKSKPTHCSTLFLLGALMV